jgi:hypothetical protein
MGPLDTLNSVLINSVVFAFVPMLTACGGSGAGGAVSETQPAADLGIFRRRGGRDCWARPG